MTSKVPLERVNVFLEEEIDHTCSLYHGLFFARYYNQSKICTCHLPLCPIIFFFHLLIEIISITSNEWAHCLVAKKWLITALVLYCCTTNHHIYNSLTQHTFTVPRSYILPPCPEPQTQLTWLPCSGSHRPEMQVLVRQHSQVEDQLGKDDLPKFFQLLEKFISLQL